MDKTYTVSIKSAKGETLYASLTENRRAPEGFSLNTSENVRFLSSSEATVAVTMLRAAGARPACSTVA